MNVNKLNNLLLILTAIIISGCAFIRPHPEKLFELALKNQPYDVIIVPGVPYYEVPRDSIMKGRVIWANYLIQRGIAKNVIFSGGAVYTQYIEAKIFSLYAQAIGIPKDKIFIEDKAQHSTENVYYSYLIAKKLGFKKIAVATDFFQSPQLMGFTKRKVSRDIDFIPFIGDTLKKINNVNPIIDPESAKVDDFHSITETQSKWYRFKGMIGKNIKFEKK